MVAIFLLVTCIAVQLFALGLGLFLFTGTYWRRFWLLPNIILVIIGLRRCILLILDIRNQSLSGGAIMTEVTIVTTLTIIIAGAFLLLHIMFKSIEKTEATLRENEARFRSIVENTSAGYFCSDKAGHYTYVNPAWLKMHGYDSPDEVIGRHFSFTRNDADAKSDREYQEILWSGKPVSLGESSCRRKDGSVFHHTFSMQPVLHNGEVVEIEGFMIDMTERWQAEQALRESEEKYHHLFMGSRDALMTLDILTGKFISGNPSTLELFRVDNETAFCEYTPWALSPEFQPDGSRSEEEVHRIIERVLTEGAHFFEWTHKRTDNEKFLATVLLTRITTSEETLLQATVRDVTEQKRAEQALRDGEQRYKQLAQLSRTITWETNAAGLCTYLSDTVETVLGYKPEELIGKRHCYEFGPQSEWERAKIHALQVLEAKEPFVNRENKIMDKKGNTVWLSSNGMPILDQQGTLLGYRGMDTDITDRKKMQEEKERLQEQFVHTQKIECVGRLAGGVAHDYNNKLGVILGYLEVAMRHAGSNETLRASLEKIEKAAKSSVNLTRQILTFARKQEATPQQINLNDTVDGLLGMMQKVIGEDIELTWKPENFDSWITIDPVQVDQILANLLLNARDAIDGTGSIVVETSVADVDEDYCEQNTEAMPGAYVVLTVSDTGCGMDKETQANIFEPFFTTKDVGKGTGLGLSTVYGIVKQNDGFINIYSEPDRGTTFHVYFPKRDAPPAFASFPEAEEVVHEVEKTILVVEDETDLLELCRLMLDAMGYKVFTAQSPADAVRIVEEQKEAIHLLITDVVLPAMNGRDLAEKMQAHVPDIKVLYMSGYTADVIAHRGLLESDVHFLQKPFSSNLLATKVQEALHGA